jgi:hypothetical protein
MGGEQRRFGRNTFHEATVAADSIDVVVEDFEGAPVVPVTEQGAAGYGKYYGAAFADFTIGDYMTEAIFPSLLRQDPRYFRKGIGSGWSRLGYAMGQIFWTHTDSGGTQFNFSEVIGNSTAVAISNAYYSDNRTASDAIARLGTQLGVDMASNILKEFWPDITRKFGRKHSSKASSHTR